jgi:hypothetical protein
LHVDLGGIRVRLLAAMAALLSLSVTCRPGRSVYYSGGASLGGGGGGGARMLNLLTFQVIIFFFSSSSFLWNEKVGPSCFLSFGAGFRQDFGEFLGWVLQVLNLL